MEQLSGEQTPDFETPAVQMLAEHRHDIWYMRHFLDGDMPDPPRSLYQHTYQQDFLHDVYGTGDFWSTMQAARCGQKFEGRSDFQIWFELSRQARLGFDEENNPMWNGKFWLEGIDDMSETAKIAGAAIAAEDVFARFAEGSHTRDEVLVKLQSMCELGDAAMRDIIRLLALPGGTDGVQAISNAVFTEAVMHPGGLVRRAVSDDEGRINTVHFGGAAIIPKNISRSFHGIIKQTRGSAEEFEAFRRDYPDEYAALTTSFEFLENAHAELRDSFLDLDRRDPVVPEAVFGVIPREDAATIAKLTYEGLRDYVNKLETERKERGGCGLQVDRKALENFGIRNYSAPDYIWTYLRNLREITEELSQPAAS